MDILHAIVLILLCMIILFNVKLPSSVRSVGTIPLTIGLLMGCFYLFTKSPLLGVIALVAAYEVMQTQSINTILVQSDPVYTETQFGETLEEQVVSNIVPMVKTTTPAYLKFNYNGDNSHNAASCSS
jgi:hypothetical protein